MKHIHFILWLQILGVSAFAKGKKHLKIKEVEKAQKEEKEDQTNEKNKKPTKKDKKPKRSTMSRLLNNKLFIEFETGFQRLSYIYQIARSIGYSGFGLNYILPMNVMKKLKIYVGSHYLPFDYRGHYKETFYSEGISFWLLKTGGILKFKKGFCFDGSFGIGFSSQKIRVFGQNKTIPDEIKKTHFLTYLGLVAKWEVLPHVLMGPKVSVALGEHKIMLLAVATSFVF